MEKTFQQETYESGKILKTTYFNPSTGKEIGSVNQDAQGNIINGTSVTYYAFNNAGLLDEPKLLILKNIKTLSLPEKLFNMMLKQVRF